MDIPDKILRNFLEAVDRRAIVLYADRSLWLYSDGETEEVTTLTEWGLDGGLIVAAHGLPAPAVLTERGEVLLAEVREKIRNRF